MAKGKLTKVVEREVKLLERSTRLLAYRRLNWQVDTRHKIRHMFERFVQETRAAKYPFSLHVSDHELAAEGIVQIAATRFPTGAVSRTTTNDWNTGERVVDTPILEEGGTLAASLSVSGYVAFVVYPRKSERIKPAEEQLLISHRLDPADVTEKVIQKALRRYLLYMRSTSVIGVHNTIGVREYFTLIGMKIGDVRYQHKLLRALLSMQNEWGKLLFGALLGWLAAYATGSGR